MGTNASRRPLSYDVYKKACPSRTILDVLANKWTHLVICALSEDGVRFGELSRRIEGVTPKMLTQTLRLLERDGLVERTLYPEIPPRVEYRLSEAGKEVIGLLEAILDWSERHVPQMLKAREAAEARAAAE